VCAAVVVRAATTWQALVLGLSRLPLAASVLDFVMKGRYLSFISPWWRYIEFCRPSTRSLRPAATWRCDLAKRGFGQRDW
jgi:hypothetical protein